MKKTVSTLAALLLVLALALSACTVSGGRIDAESMSSVSPNPTSEPSSVLPTETPTETAPIPPETTVSTQIRPGSGDDALIRWQNGGARDYLPDEPVAMVPFSEMVYERPDTEAMFAAFDELIEQGKSSEDADALLLAYENVYDQYINFYSMDSLANIRHSLDTTDSYYSTEYDWCEAQSPSVEEKLELLNKAFAAGPARNALEEAYFGDGYFLQYDDYEVYTNETYLALAKQEEEVLSEYRSLTAEPTVVYNGEEQPFWDLMNTSSYSQYMTVLKSYYEKYNPLVGDCYLRLVRIRKQMAEALGYESYADYAYDVTYGRDYTPEQGSAFLDEIQTELVPLSEEISEDNGLLSMLNADRVSEAAVREMLESAVQTLGGTILDAWNFMNAYELCDITKADEKLDGSFQTYLYSFEAPFVFVNSQGNSGDYTTFSHEFGHFTDSYYNYGAEEDLETAETFSQSMEFLALTYSNRLTEAQKQRYLKMQLMDIVNTFISQAAFASFEDRVYALSDEELDLDTVNGLFLQTCEDFGIAESGFDFYYSQYWIDVLHFFEVPYYVISYCVSAQTTMEVYELEVNHTGDGVDAYFRLLDREHEAGVQQVMEDAGLENPFREGAIGETARFIEAQLNLQ